MVNEPVVTVLPTEEPDTMPHSAEEMTATFAGPPEDQPASRFANAVGKAERDAHKQRQHDREDQRPALLERVAAQQRRAHHDRAERQVDAACDDDERHAEGHKADIIAGFENILDRIERQEVIAED